MDWDKWLKDLLCKMYQKWGGDCATLGPGPGDWVGTVAAEYEGTGAPTFANTSDKNKFLTDLDELEDGLKSTNNTLSSTQNSQLLSLIASLRSDLA